MADSDKNIVITPNRSQTAQPTIVFTGKGNVPITLKLLDDSNGTMSFEGSAGQLFSINNNLSTGTIFSVNDISGVPMIDVDASGLVRLAPLGGTTYSNTLYGVPRTVAGSGNSVTIRAADGLTSGAGGSIILQPGQQATTGGNGVVVVRQPGGTAGTDELQIYHDGTHTYFANKDTSGNIYFDVPTGSNPGLFIRRSDFTTQSLKLTAGDIDNLATVQSVSADMQLRSGSGDVWIRPGTASNYVTNWFALRLRNLNGQNGAILRIPGNNPAGILQLYDNADSSGGSIAYPAATPTTLAANTNDLVLNSSAIQRLSASAAYNLTGIAPPATASHADGRVIWLHNVGSFNITLKHSQSSVAGNQFINENGGDIVLGPNRIVQCTYDGTSTKWRVHGEMYPYNLPTADGTNGQVLTTNGSGTLSWSTATGLGGSGTTNYIVKFTGSTTAGNSIIYDNGTNVGIGTASPNNKLHIYAGTGSVSLTLQAGAAYAYFVNDQTDGILASNQGTTGHKFRYNLNAPDNSLYINNTGAVGVNSTSPGAKLHVETGAAGTKGLIVKDLVVGTLNAGTFPTGALAPLHVTRSTTAVATAIAAWPTYEPETQTHARIVAYMSDGGNGGTATVGTGTTNIVQFGEYYTGRVVLMPLGAGGQTPSDQNSGAGRDIMLLGGKSDNTVGKTGGRVFIQGGTGFNAIGWGANFGNVALQANGGYVGIGTTAPNKKLTVAANGADSTINIYKSPDGTINSAQLVAVLGTGSSQSNAGTTGGNEFGILDLSHSGTVRCRLYAYSGGGGSNNYVLDGMSFGQTSAAAGQVVVAPVSNTTKGLIVKGAASQSATLQEWQNNGGTALASVDANGNISAASVFTDGGYKSSYTAEYVFVRAAPTTVGNYVEICNFDEQRTAMQIMAVSESGSGIGTTIKIYNFVSAYGTGRNTILTPIMMTRQGGYESTFDFEIESWSDATNFRLRLRRTRGTSARNVAIYIKTLSIGGQGNITSATGTGTSSVSAAYNYGVLGAYLAAPPVIGGSGAGNSLALYAGNGETSGAGGSIILQPGAQATSGGDGSIRFVNPSNTGQYMSVAVSSTQVVFSLTGIADSTTNIQINHNVYLPSKALWCGAATIGNFLISGATMRATNGTSTQLGSSNGTSTDNINYIWMRQDGHIAWYGDVGLRRDNVGILTVTNGSTGGGSLAYKSNTTNISAATNDLVLNGSAFQRLNCTTACNLTGVAPPSGSHIDGRMMRIYNVGTANLTLKHNSTSSAVANRFCCVQAVDIILAPRDYAELIYDGTDGGLVAGQNNPCWRVA